MRLHYWLIYCLVRIWPTLFCRYFKEYHKVWNEWNVK
jgi:hypothetical protein